MESCKTNLVLISPVVLFDENEFFRTLNEVFSNGIFMKTKIAIR